MDEDTAGGEKPWFEVKPPTPPPAPVVEPPPPAPAPKPIEPPKVEPPAPAPKKKVELPVVEPPPPPPPPKPAEPLVKVEPPPPPKSILKKVKVISPEKGAKKRTAEDMLTSDPTTKLTSDPNTKLTSDPTTKLTWFRPAEKTHQATNVLVDDFLNLYTRMLMSFWEHGTEEPEAMLSRTFINELLPQMDLFVNEQRNRGFRPRAKGPPLTLVQLKQRAEQWAQRLDSMGGESGKRLAAFLRGKIGGFALE